MVEGLSNSNFTQNFGGNGAAPNNSGQGTDAQPPAEVLTGFNWGAFFLNWIWGLGNNSFITLVILVISFIPFVNLLTLPVAIWFGVKGNEWAWQNKKWNSIEHFHSVQKMWAAWGIGILVATFVLCFLAAIIMCTLASQST